MGLLINMYLMDGGVDGPMRLKIPNFSGSVTHYPSKEWVETDSLPKTGIFILRNKSDVYIDWVIDWLGQGTVEAKIGNHRLNQPWESCTFISTEDGDFMQPLTVISIVNQLKRDLLLTNRYQVITNTLATVTVTQEISSQVHDFLSRLKPLLGVVGYQFNILEENQEQEVNIEEELESGLESEELESEELESEELESEELESEELESEENQELETGINVKPIVYDPTTTDGNCYYIKGEILELEKGIVKADGYFTDTGFKVKEGARVKRNGKPDKLISRVTGKLVNDIPFDDAITAAKYVLGDVKVTNSVWKNKYGASLSDLKEFELPEGSIECMAFLDDLGVVADGYLLPDDSFLLKAGSKRSTLLPTTFSNYNIFVKRKDFIDNIGKVNPITNKTRCHIHFNSLSAATMFLTMRSKRLVGLWKTEDGVDIWDILEERRKMKL